jgi:hypothetical protein
VTSGTPLSQDERYRWHNDSLSVGVGEVSSQEDGPTELVIEWAEVVWGRSAIFGCAGEVAAGSRSRDRHCVGRRRLRQRRCRLASAFTQMAS